AATSAAATDSPTAAATGGQQTGDAAVDKAKLAETLNVYAWSDYIAPETVKGFEDEYGVKVSIDTYGNNEDMIAKVRPGSSGYDVVQPSDYAVQIMASDKLLAPLDKAMLPNLSSIKPENLDLYFDKGNVYSVPFNYGTTGLAYSKKAFPTPPDSWAVVFDAAQAEQRKGQFSMLDDSREVPGAALKYLGKSLNDTDAANLAQAEELLKAQKPFLASYDSDTVSRKLAAGEIVIAQCYNGVALQARMGIEGDFDGNADIGFFIPKEGGTIWQDNFAVLADSPNQYTAFVFLNYMLRPEVAAQNTAYNLGLSPNADAEKLLPADIATLYNEGFAPSADTIKRLEWIERNDKTGAFDTLWTAVKGE
ncbi:MAG: spermidine/putrescine ABC transporter substrate-binding protein, partial [Chloroflexales bacterium]|nr:spermidine/putrescine ABC transporter substrate-binding protein [Chloroflexales bacterium]